MRDDQKYPPGLSTPRIRQKEARKATREADDGADNPADEYPDAPSVVSLYDVPVVHTEDGWEVLRAIHDDADLLAAAEALIEAVRRQS